MIAAILSRGRSIMHKSREAEATLTAVALPSYLSVGEARLPRPDGFGGCKESCQPDPIQLGTLGSVSHALPRAARWANAKIRNVRFHCLWLMTGTTRRACEARVLVRTSMTTLRRRTIRSGGMDGPSTIPSHYSVVHIENMRLFSHDATE